MTAGRDGQFAVYGGVLGADDDLLALRQDHGRGELADAELRALQVGDERDRAADLGGDLTDEPRALGVILVLSVRQVQPHSVDAGGDQLAQALPRVRCRTKRRHDLRPTLFLHGAQST